MATFNVNDRIVLQNTRMGALDGETGTVSQKLPNGNYEIFVDRLGQYREYKPNQLRVVAPRRDEEVRRQPAAAGQGEPTTPNPEEENGTSTPTAEPPKGGKKSRKRKGKKRITRKKRSTRNVA